MYCCNVCGDRDHNKYKCKKIENDYGAFPLGNKDKVAKDTLVMNIVSPQSLSGYPIFQKHIDDIRNIIKEFS